MLAGVRMLFSFSRTENDNLDHVHAALNHCQKFPLQPPRLMTRKPVNSPLENLMSLRKNGQALHFPCECVSVQHGYSDPWAGVTQNKLLNDGTKERVLNSVARKPKTIARLAKELGLS